MTTETKDEILDRLAELRDEIKDDETKLAEKRAARNELIVRACKAGATADEAGQKAGVTESFAARCKREAARR